jgi:Excreted virulence factor EspC, type VII ESX diderm
MQAVPDGGFSVDLAELGGVAGQIGVAYDDLTTAITQYGQEAAAPGDFGSEVAGSWSDFDGAWAQELNVLGLAITEMASKVHTAGTNYATADSASARDIDGVVDG